MWFLFVISFKYEQSFNKHFDIYKMLTKCNLCEFVNKNHIISTSVYILYINWPLKIIDFLSTCIKFILGAQLY